MKEIELQISQFIDNELNDHAQKKLFGVLAENKSARQTLFDFMQIKKGIAEHHGSITEILNPKPFLLRQTESNIGFRNKYKALFYISTAAAVILAMLLFINHNEIQKESIQFASLQNQYNSLQMENAKALIEKESRKGIQKESILIATTSKSKNNRSDKVYLTKNIQSTANSNQLKRMSQISEIIQANKAVITKDDFIGGQIVGN